MVMMMMMMMMMIRRRTTNHEVDGGNDETDDCNFITMHDNIFSKVKQCLNADTKLNRTEHIGEQATRHTIVIQSSSLSIHCTNTVIDINSPQQPLD